MNFSMQVHKGEILGFVGLRGAGRTELMQCIFGLTRPEAGTIELNGEKVAMDYTDFRDYFPPKTTDRQIHKVLIKLVRIWHRQQQLKKTQEAR